MKKIILKTVAIGLMLAGATAAYADTSVEANASAEVQVRPTFMQQIKARLQGIKDIRVETKADVKGVRVEAEDKVKAMREGMASTSAGMKAEVRADMMERGREMMENRIENRFGKMNARIEATIERMENIMARINTRIEKIKNAGGNTTAAEKLVVDAKVSIDLAKTALVNLKATSDTTVALESATTTRAQAKASLTALAKTAKEIEKNLQKARESLVKVIGNLRGVSQLHATSTTSINN